MPPETATATPPTQAEPKKTATNIVKGVTDKASGKVPFQKGPEKPDDGDEKNPIAKTVDPNAGKKKYVVNGKDVWLTPEQADAYVQKGIAFEPRMSDLARMQQEIQMFQRALIDNPGKILTALAQREKIPVETMMERVLGSHAVNDNTKEVIGRWYWENVAKRARMDPKEREILEKDERIRQLEAQDKSRADMAVAQENRVRVVKALGEISSQIQETLKELGINAIDSPAAIRLTKEIADIMRVSYFSRQPCTAKQAAEKVKARIFEYQKQFYDGLDVDKLVETLGKENAEKVRKHFLKAVKEAEKSEIQGNRSSPPLKRDERKTMNMDDFHDYLDELKKTSK